MGWRSGQAYADDLRQRVLAAVDDGMPAYRAAAVFRVSVSYIYKALIRRRTTGETGARRQRSHRIRKLAPVHGALRARLEAAPDTTLKELQAFLKAEHGISAALATIAEDVRLIGFTRKKRR